jgi:hypothetical protein
MTYKHPGMPVGCATQKLELMGKEGRTRCSAGVPPAVKL